ncbi:hypothetical protein LIER_29806 [Lithospermum erythrorhizon]|uniref:Uncharacterized protein n=1 Tax=Lithospermum erythrorhizon TaxID=34254 RepID=A0AAV3RP18_LITER
MGSESTSASLSTSRSPEPLSVRLPAVSENIRHPNDTSTSAGNSQACASAQDTGNIPTIIRDSLPVPFIEEHLRNFRRHFSIPFSVDMRLLGEGDQVYEPVLDPSATECPHCPGWTSLYIESMYYGLRFPFSRFVNRLLIAVNRDPGQIRLELLSAGQASTVPNKVPFSTMMQKRVTLFKRVGLKTKTSTGTTPPSSTTVTSGTIIPTTSVAPASVSTSAPGKRSAAPAKPLFGTRKKARA